MKTLKEVNEARETLRNRIMGETDLSREQLVLLCGMLNALVWVAEGPSCSTIEAVLVGEPFGKGDAP